MALDETAPPVVLVLGFCDSVHTARWLNMVRGRGIRFVLFPIYKADLSRELDKTRRIADAVDLTYLTDEETGVFDVDSVLPAEIEATQAQVEYHPWRPEAMQHITFIGVAHVAAAIRRLRPMMVHSMVVQFGGYLAFAAKQYLQQEFPFWLLSNWGSDIFLYRKHPDHRQKLHEILNSIDAYHAECERDVQIARQMGFRRLTFPTLPASGGVDFSTFPRHDMIQPPSQRREILIKGYQGWAGRALNILASVHLAADVLRGYKIRITLAEGAVSETSSAIREIDGLDIAVESYLPHHHDALLRLANARVVIGLGISDGIATTLLEAMAVGTFPIQGSNSCGMEWAKSGESAIFVSPHDVGELAEAIRRAVSDDALVDAAAAYNRAVVETRWDSRINGDLAAQSYRMLLESIRRSHPLDSAKIEIAGLHA